MQQIMARDNRSAVIIVDSMVLRRAGVVGVLREWAEANQVSITSVPPDMLDTTAGLDTRFALGVLNLGGLSLSSAAPINWLENLIKVLPETPMVVVSDRDDIDEVVAAFRTGARGFVPTSTEPEVALQAFSFIMGGGSYFPPQTLLDRLQTSCARNSQMNARQRDGETKVHSCSLTVRQQAVLNHLQEGQPNKIIARLLGMRESTVKVHVRHLMKKLGTSNRTQAAIIGFAAPQFRMV